MSVLGLQNSSEQKDEGKNGESNTLVLFGALYKSEKYPHMLMYQTLQHLKKRFKVLLDGLQ